MSWISAHKPYNTGISDDTPIPPKSGESLAAHKIQQIMT